MKERQSDRLRGEEKRTEGRKEETNKSKESESQKKKEKREREREEDDISESFRPMISHLRILGRN